MIFLMNFFSNLMLAMSLHCGMCLLYSLQVMTLLSITLSRAVASDCWSLIWWILC